MPVTFHPSTQTLSAIPKHFLQRNTKDSLTILKGSTSGEISATCKEIFQSSFGEQSTVPSHSGFVYSCIEAYNTHHHLVLRPDDVWITILTQFNFYVNAHSEELRHLFVAHKGKKTLKVTAVRSRHTVDFGNLAEQMGMLIQKNVIDPSLREWIVPDFTTTTTNDRIVSCVVMMSTLKAYFSYYMGMACGLPAVTLLGEQKDWQKLLTRIEKLPSFGKETAQWYNLLRPVLSRFVSAFDNPESKENKDFWQTIVHRDSGICSPTYLSGWITAFCFFSDEGKVLYKQTEWSNNSRNMIFIGDGDASNAPKVDKKGFVLDGVKYHRLDTMDIPAAYAQVDVKLNDNGQEFDTTMVAGVVGIRISDSGNGLLAWLQAFVAGKHDEKNNSLQPVAGWWIFNKREAKAEEK